MASGDVRLTKPALDMLLPKLGEARRGLNVAERQLRRGCVHGKALAAVRGEIDELARVLTGDPTYFHAKVPTGNTAFKGNES